MYEIKKIGLGIIGLGAMGLEMFEVAVEHTDFEVRICSDINEALLGRMKARYPQIEFSSSSADVTGSADIDAVYIAVPPHLHAELSIAAMRSGKAVFCEKPLSIKLADGEAMVKTAKDTGMVNALNFALADRHAALELQRAIEAGEVGKILGVETRLNFPRWPREFQAGAGWLDGRSQGGFIREVFSHFAFLTDKLLGELSKEFIKVSFPGPDDRSETFAFALFNASGVPVDLIGRTGAAAPESYEWRLYGEKRSYFLKDWGELFVSTENGTSMVALTGERGSEATRMTSFAKATRTGQQQRNLPDFAAGLRVQKVVETFYS